VNWDALARSSGTIVILMGVAHLHEICTGLVDRGLASGTPAAVVARAATPHQRVIRGSLTSLPALAAEADIEPPALIVIGAVVGLDLGPAVPSSTTGE
jgi:siroheme synthase